MHDQTFDSSNTSLGLQWDDSPEQYQLDEDIQETGLAEAIQPRVLFPMVDEDNPANDTITSEESSDDNVFNDEEYQNPSGQPKLKRNNAT